MFLFCLVFAMSLCPSVNICFMFTCWETVLEISNCPLAPPRYEFAGGKLGVSEGCPLDNLKF